MISNQKASAALVAMTVIWIAAACATAGPGKMGRAAASGAPSVSSVGPTQSGCVPGVRLRFGAVRENTWSFLLENGGPSVIEGIEWMGLQGHVEQQTMGGRWVMDQRRLGCATGLVPTGDLPTCRSMSVGELPPTSERGPYPPGRYRFVLPFVEVGGRARKQVVLPFVVRGLDADRTTALIEMLDSREVAACEKREIILQALISIGAAERLSMLLDVGKDAPLDTRVQTLQLLARSPAHVELLVSAAAQAEALKAIPAAIAIVTTFSCEQQWPICRVAVERLAASIQPTDDPPSGVTDALALTPELWPADLVDRLVIRLRRSPSDEARVRLVGLLAKRPTVWPSELPRVLIGLMRKPSSDALRVPIAHALVAASKPGSVLSEAASREAVAVIRSAARAAKRPSVRDELLSDARQIEAPTADTSDSIGEAFGTRPSLGFGGSPECDRVIAKILELQGGRRGVEPNVRFEESSIEAYREPVWVWE